MFRVGLAYDVFQTSAGRLSVLGEFTQPNNNLPGFNLGGEYNLRLGGSGFSVAARGSVTYWPDNTLSVPDSAAENYAGFTSSVGGTSKYRGVVRRRHVLPARDHGLRSGRGLRVSQHGAAGRREHAQGGLQLVG